MPPPVPPIVKEGRMIAGRPMSSRMSSAAESVLIWCERGVDRPILVIASRNFSRSSALSIASAVAPIISTSCVSSTPIFCNDSAQFKAVWPPIVGKRAKPPGATWRSLAMILATTSGVIGST